MTTTNVTNKGLFNSVSISVLLILISISVVLCAQQIVNLLIFVFLIFFLH
jgi:hypothetical protein